MLLLTTDPTGPVSLTETGPGVQVALRPAQVATLIRRPDLVRLTPAASGLWRVSGRQRVGLVRLGRGDATVELRIRPKLPVSQLLFLLTHAPGTPWQDQPVTASASDDALLPALADAYARAARRALDPGVLHGYRVTDDELPVVRGRIRTADQLRRTGLPLPVAVRYDDFTADIAENRVLLAALHRLERLPGVTDTARRTLRHLAGRLPEVTPLRPGTPLPTWTPTRLNSRYAPALRLAELILTDRGISPHDGPTPVTTDGFVLDLARVFERFLTDTLTAALVPHRIRVRPQDRRHHLDVGSRVRIRPDLVLYRAGRPLTVVDAKYIDLGAAPPPHEHMYQLLSYCTALALPHGHLVYAAQRGDAPVRHPIRNAGITVTTHAVDLARPPTEILASVTALADRLAQVGD
ncbi:McrC family protein [Streptomyces sp. NBC_00075]|uniref:McrC family protein n=1 Tax=Streptomyces sp. NBC_00075 TaxID=2975641 RepID=UPI003253EE84